MTWFDAEAECLEVTFSDAAGYMTATNHDAVMERLDAAGQVVGFSILGVSRFKKENPLEAASFGRNPAEFQAAVVSRVSKKAAENRRDFAGDATQAGAALPQAAIQQGGRLGGIKDFLYQGALIKKAFAVRMALVKPMGQEPGAHLGTFPQPPAILEAGDIIVIRIRPPYSGLVGLFKLLHRPDYTMPRRFAQAA